ncbi:hypothetical protein FA13DRAFT_299784 [Coprinellus micaceus]|uniref:Homeobox domain-containing protein n=1 Tax=Coprinellus micaceus TaxID=71717 RepID=A0A4Y7SDU0_COPMI|nr:hypothetical protein FA13DRAFT_299784 [Coprinellus micaceus]
MREEVGRAIGLSARKVQIWFQNQRQKARRPRTHGDPAARPPQYGSFPQGPSMFVYPGTGQIPIPSLSPYTLQGPSTSRNLEFYHMDYPRGFPSRDPPMTASSEANLPDCSDPASQGISTLDIARALAMGELRQCRHHQLVLIPQARPCGMAAPAEAQRRQ